jgi:CheY-like chemotaxis protein
MTEVASPARIVLLAEDDPMILAFVHSVLRSHGYRVLLAADGIDALRLAGRVGLENIDLLLTDIEMPRLDGIALVSRLQQLRPEVKVLYMTGSGCAHQIQDGRMLIEKPFPWTTLLRHVEACLASPASLAAGAAAAT